jgi:BirA family biotin operon repressor/biotin-[acetyl-CoA-carboxylase] ligase
MTLSSFLPFVERHLHFAETASTNDHAKTLTELPQNGIMVITADRQSAGRGQRGNSFFSSIAGGLWVTIVAPLERLEDHFIHNRAVSLSVCDVIGGNLPERRVTVKWPNDVYIGDRKVCGILLESMPESKGHLIIGFGVNINLLPDQFPAEIRDIATSLLIESKKAWDPALLLRDMLAGYYVYKSADQNGVHERYRASLYGRGHQAEIHGKRGVFEDVLPDGRLCLKTDRGVEHISSGPMRLL